MNELNGLVSVLYKVNALVSKLVNGSYTVNELMRENMDLIAWMGGLILLADLFLLIDFVGFSVTETSACCHLGMKQRMMRNRWTKPQR